jgi:hypothetical protein
MFQALELSKRSLALAGADWDGHMNAATEVAEVLGNKRTRGYSGPKDHSPAIVLVVRACLVIEVFYNPSRRSYGFLSAVRHRPSLNLETRSEAAEAAVKNDGYFRKFRRHLGVGQASWHCLRGLLSMCLVRSYRVCGRNFRSKSR